MILAGDIGGTKTILSVFARNSNLHEPIVEYTFKSQDFPDLQTLIAHCMRTADYPIEAASFGVAGPVLDGRAMITNLPWVVDEAHLRDTLRIPIVRIINDLQAVAYAVPVLESSDLLTINNTPAASKGTIAVIAPGTGLGEAFLTWDGHHYQAYPSEGGHTSFAARNAEQVDMLNYLFTRYEHVSYERVCSGSGLPNIYHYYREHRQLEELPAVSAALAEAKDPTPIIVQAAFNPEGPSPLCRRAVDMFVTILAAESGNLALKLLATGGVYIGGGMPLRVLEALDGETFMQAFSDKGRFRTFLEDVPVHIITNKRAALIGAAHHGQLLLED